MHIKMKHYVASVSTVARPCEEMESRQLVQCPVVSCCFCTNECHPKSHSRPPQQTVNMLSCYELFVLPAMLVTLGHEALRSLDLILGNTLLSETFRAGSLFYALH